MIVGPAASSMEAFEDSLRSSLYPVQPDPVFVGHLHQQLTNRSPGPAVEMRTPNLPLFALVGAAAMGLLFAWLYRRSRH